MGLTKRKDSYYVEFFVEDNGKVLSLAPPGTGKLKRWKVGSRHKEEAKKQEAILKTKLMDGISIKPDLPPRPVSFGEYADRWLSTAKGSLAVKTHANYTQLLRLYIMPALKDHKLTGLTWGTIKTFLMAKQQTGLSVNSVRLMRAVISTILTDAAEEGIIPINPVLGQRRKRRASQNSQPDVQPMSWEQKQTFEEQLDHMEHSRALSPPMRCCFTCT